MCGLYIIIKHPLFPFINEKYKLPINVNAFDDIVKAVVRKEKRREDHHIGF